MTEIQTSSLRPDGSDLSADVAHQVYCGLDSMITLEALRAIKKHNQGWDSVIYAFERALQAPLLDMALRGFRIDSLERHRYAQETEKVLLLAKARLNALADAVWRSPLNPNSPKQLCEFLYGRMKLPEQWLSFKGVKRLSTNREALEKLDDYVLARPFVDLILTCKDLTKSLSTLTTEIDPDGRYRTFYHISPNTGRLSSSISILGTGGNTQNIAPRLRRIFRADPGFKLCTIDEEQTEARDVGFLLGSLFGDWRLLDSCEGGDFHTQNAKLVWPELDWTGDAKHDRQIAEGSKVYRDWSYRDLAKRGGHLCNYDGSAWTMARSLKLPLAVATEFQNRYARGASPAYPALREYWRWIAESLQRDGELTTPFGRRRQFFDRLDDDATRRTAIAFIPQSMTADRTNLWLWRVWKAFGDSGEAQLLAQTHDSISFQYRDRPETEQRIIAQVLSLLDIPLVARGRRYSARGDIQVGWNWGKREEGPNGPTNPWGLMKFKLGQTDPRSAPSPDERLLEA